MFDHIPTAAFGSLHHSGPGSLGFLDTIVMFAVVGTLLYGGLYALIKLGELLRRARDFAQRL